MLSPTGPGMMFDPVATSAGLSHSLLATAVDPANNVMGNSEAEAAVMSAFDTQDHHHRSGFMAEGVVPEPAMSPLDLASHDATMAMLTSGAMFQQDYFGHGHAQQHQQHHHHLASPPSMTNGGQGQGDATFAPQQHQQQQPHQDDGTSTGGGMTADDMRAGLDNSWLGNLQAEGAAAAAAYADAEGQDSWPGDLAN